MKKTLPVILLLLNFWSACAQPSAEVTPTNFSPSENFNSSKNNWNPDAGVIPSLTKNAKVIVSSNPKMANQVLDEKKETHWQSGAPFPNNFFNRADQNILLKYLEKGNFHKASNIKNAIAATDGNFQNTTAHISPKDGVAFLQIHFPKLQNLETIILRANNVTNPIEIFVQKNNQRQSVGFFKKENDFKTLRFPTKIKGAQAIILKSKTAFSISEIAALEAPAKEWAMVDLGQIQKIGWVSTRHWAGEGSAVSTNLQLSTDGKNWTKIKDLDPAALQTVTTIINPPVPARYIKLEHGVLEKDWNSVFIWEIDAYDENGPFGKIPTAKPNPNSFAEMLGVNGIWGWGFEKYSDEITPKRGPELFGKISSHARNYHFLNWDVMDPDTPPNYLKMAAGKGTEAQWWLDWNREYQVWKKNNMKLQTSIQFRDIPKSQWDDPYKAGYQFAYNFAQHFGPTHGNGLVETLEAGNEPWYYEADFYKKILLGMVKGAKDADPAMKVLPCALQSTYPANEYEGQFKNYMGARVTPEVKNHIDALNVHLVPWTIDEQGKQIATHPEHPYNSMRGIFNDIRFRDHNLPGLPIYVTEWGWDSEGGKEACVHGECVSERAQALYAIRGALMLARVGIDRATWYFFANENKESSLFTRSGLVSSLSTDFNIKQAFVAWQSFLHHLGDRHFLEVLREDDDAWVYVLGKKDGTPTHLIAWRPVDGDDLNFKKINISFSKSPKSSWLLQGKTFTGTKKPTPTWENGRMEIEIGAAPLLIELEN